MTRIVYATYDGWDNEREAIVDELRARGIDAAPVVWDAPGVDWSAYDLVVLRSTWDYFRRRDEWLAWARSVDAVTRLLNPVEVLEHNTDKTYLRDLATAGVPVVPSIWLEPGERGDDDALLALGPEVVVKPHVSAGARDTIRTTEPAAALAQVAAIHASGRIAMVQPYLGMVELEGETSLLYLGDAYSHAVRRMPQLVTDPVQDGGTAREPTADQRELAERVLDHIPRRRELLYARVDLVRLPDGTPALIELELAEPYLFLSHAPGAVERFADLLIAAAT